MLIPMPMIFSQWLPRPLVTQWNRYLMTTCKQHWFLALTRPMHQPALPIHKKLKNKQKMEQK
jgi:hypothetical protein